MFKKMLKIFNKKNQFNNFRLNKQQAFWLLINEFKRNRIEVIEEELIKQLDEETSIEQLGDMLKTFNLEIKKGFSDSHVNIVLFEQKNPVEKDNNEVSINVVKNNKNIEEIGVITQLDNNYYQVVTLGKEVTISKEDIFYQFFIEKAIEYVSESDKEIEPKFSFNWFLKELFNYKQLWKRIIVWSILIQLVSFALPLMTQTIIDKVIVNQAQSTLITLIGGVFIFNLFNVLLTWARQNIVLFIGNKIDNTLAIKLMTKLFHLPITYFQKRPTGIIVSRIHAVETIREFLAGSFVTLVLDIPFVFIFLIIMFYYSPLLSAITLVFVFFMMLLSIIVAPKIRNKALEQAKISGHNQGFVNEYVGSMETVKSLQIEPHLLNQYKKTFGAYLDKTKETRTLAINYNSCMTWLEQSLNLTILGIGAYLSMNGQDFTIGMLIAFQMFASRVTQPLLRISNVWQEFQQTQISMLRLKDIMDEKEEDYTILKSNTYNGIGDIKIKNLSFSYAPDLPPLYNNLNIHIPAKRLVVIKGPSGCGKSTLTKLLQGFYTHYQGDLEIDGINIKQMGTIALRNHFGIVPQETTLFSGSIIDNFKIVNPHITLDEVIKVCQSVGIHDTISKLPQAYNTQLGEKGSGLSGGQKQRIAIARALIKKPKILIFDESISSLDEESRKLVCDTIKSLNGLITMIFITHIDLGDVGTHLKIDMKNK